MQLIPSIAAPKTGRARLRVVFDTIVGALLVAIGLILCWLVLGTPLLSRFLPGSRIEPDEAIIGVVAWGLALFAPAAFLVIGASRLGAVAFAIVSARPRPTPASRLAGQLGDEYVVASGVPLPDGRIIPEIVLGPFGAAVIEELPPSRATRNRGQAWEVRGPRGEWLPFENPLDRAARDAERVRRWFAHDDRDFVVKVYAAVVSAGQAVDRTPTCAVIEPSQIPAWLLSLPAQRSLSETRRAQLVANLRGER
jgi:hypothetical protein